jgi:predicted amidohydrolase YtcJ
LGLIAPGFLADFAVWDSDFFAIDPHALLKARVLRMIVGGIHRFG